MRMCICLALLLLWLPRVLHAGHGTITETDWEIIVEYEGDVSEIKATKISKEQEEKSQLAAEERAVKLEEKHAAQRRKSEARKRAEAEAGDN